TESHTSRARETRSCNASVPPVAAGARQAAPRPGRASSRPSRVSFLPFLLLERLQIVECELAALQQMRDERLRRAADEVEQLIEEAAHDRFLRRRRREDEGVATLADALDRPLLLQAENDGLDGGVGGAPFGQRILHLPNGAFPELPEDVEDFELETRETHDEKILHL